MVSGILGPLRLLMHFRITAQVFPIFAVCLHGRTPLLLGEKGAVKLTQEN